MAVEIYKSLVASHIYYYPLEVWGFGNFFSASSHVRIIDSYSSHWWNNYPTTPKTYGTKRHKGDPFADVDGSRGALTVWASSDDIGDTNDFIVVECQTTLYPLLGLPKWQVKIQWCGNFKYYFDVSDPTGVLYPKHHNTHRCMVYRYAPWGGWDSADITPDFAAVPGVANKCTPNTRSSVSHFGGGEDVRDYIHLDDGQMLRWVRRNVSVTDSRPTSLSIIAGDIAPIDPSYMPMPRAFFTNGVTSASPMGRTGAQSWWIKDGTQLGWSGNPLVNDSVYVTYWDESLVRVAEGFTCYPFSHLMDEGRTQPNVYTGGSEIELNPYIVMPYTTKSPLFSVPFIRYGYGGGHGLVANKQWFCPSLSDYCVYMKWDGVSTLV
jgi:hypothetical protein